VRQPAYNSPEGARVRALSRVKRALYDVERARRRKPPQYDAETSRRAVHEARELIQGAPGTTQAHEARYFLFRHLQLLAEPQLAELEFENYTGEVAAADGPEAACKMLLREGVRERSDRKYPLAIKRFQTVLAFLREGELPARAHELIGQVHARLHRRSEAEASFRRAIALGVPTPFARRAYHYLVNVEYCNRDYEQALRDVKALLELPTSEAAKANDEALLGMILEKTDGPSKAIDHYRRILRKYPSAYCDRARSRLKEIETRLEDALLLP